MIILAAFLTYLTLLSFISQTIAIYPTYNATMAGRGWVYSQTCVIHYDGCKLNSVSTEFENCIYHYNNCKLNNDPTKFEQCLQTNVEPFCSLKVTTTTSTTKATTTTVVTTTTANPTTTTPVLPCCNRPPNTAAVYIQSAYISPNGIIMKQANGSCPRSGGTDYFYSPQPSADATDLFFDEKDNVHSVCEGMCVCDIQNNCYQYPEGSTNGIWLFSICQTDGCFMKAFNPTFTPLTNIINGSQIDPNDQYVNPNELKPLTDSAYLKVSKFGCGGCSALAAISLCPIIPPTSTTPLTTVLTTTTTAIPSTTTTPPSCIQPPNTSSIYIPIDTIAQIVMQSPNATCECPSGTEYYFATKDTDNTRQLFYELDQNMAAYCLDLCVCDNDDMCFRYKNPSAAGIFLYSYCWTDGCHMRTLINDPFTDFINVFTNETFTQAMQRDENQDFKPLSDPSFLNVNKVSCSGCPIQNTCKSNSTITTAIITTTTSNSLTSTMAITTLPVCNPLANTSMVFITGDSVDSIIINNIPKASCECSDGKHLYFTSQNTSDTQSIIDSTSFDMSTSCAQMCTCDDDNNCYEFNADDPGAGVFFLSYCKADGSYMRLVINVFNKVINAATNQTIIFQDQADENFIYKPLTDSIFFKLTKISCNGCPAVTSVCSETFSTETTQTLTSTTTTFTTTSTTRPFFKLKQQQPLTDPF